MDGDTVDVLRELSMARTALDDPAGLPEAEGVELDGMMSAAFRPREAKDEWVIARIDRAMETLSPSEWTPALLARSLRAIRMLAAEALTELQALADRTFDAEAERDETTAAVDDLSGACESLEAAAAWCERR